MYHSLRNAPFWAITQHVVVIPVFKGQESKVLDPCRRHLFVSRNVGQELPLQAA